MPYVDTGVSRQTGEAVERVLRDHLGPFGFDGAKVSAGVDHDGLPVLFVDIQYRWGAKQLPRDVSFGLIGSLRKALLGVGELRFPHVRHKLPDERVAPG
jgi:hypothetical protein